MMTLTAKPARGAAIRIGNERHELVDGLYSSIVSVISLVLASALGVPPPYHQTNNEWALFPWLSMIGKTKVYH
jgi:hypothetical protein